MMGSVPFEIPADLLSRVASGELIRFGTILKDASTGQIVKHLQETGVTQSILSNLASSGPFGPISALADLAGAGANAYAGVKINQLKEMINTLQLLQVATLGVSLVGVGVSVASFIYMKKRFNSLEDRLDKLAETIKSGFEDMSRRDLRKQLHTTKGLLERAEQAPALTDPRPEYSEIASRLADQAAYFEGEIAFTTNVNGPIDLHVFQQLAQMLMLCNSVRVDCRIRTNELKNALAVSESVASTYAKLFTHLTPLSFGQDVAKGLVTVRTLRDACDASASKPYLIDFLRTKKIDGGLYIETLDHETTSPYLFLNTSQSV